MILIISTIAYILLLISCGFSVYKVREATKECDYWIEEFRKLEVYRNKVQRWLFADIDSNYCQDNCFLHQKFIEQGNIDKIYLMIELEYKYMPDYIKVLYEPYLVMRKLSSEV